MDSLKSIGGALIGIAAFIGLIIVGVLIFQFGAGVALKISPFVNGLAGLLLVLDVFLLLFALIPRARKVVGLIIYLSSYVFGLSAWIYGLAVTLALWGWVAVIIGILLGGVGVVPIGMLAAIFNGEWGTFWTLLLTVIFTYGARLVGYALASSAESQGNQINDTVIDVEPEDDTKRTWRDIE